MKTIILSLLLLIGCGSPSNVSTQELTSPKYNVGDLVRVKISSTRYCKGYIADMFSTAYDHYKISPIICNGQQYYDVWVTEHDISR